jgi:HEAT repeat protein
MLVSEDPAIMGDLPILRIGFPVSEDLGYMCLTKIGSDARDALPVLLAAAKKSPRTSPPKVLHLLGMVGGESKEAIDLLQEALKSDSAEVRMHAASGLLLAKPHDAEALKYLMDSLESDNEQLQKSAMEALARVGPSAKPAVPSIVKILKVTSEEEVTSEEARVREARVREISEVLARIGPGAKEAVPELERLLTKGDYDFQLADALASALAKQGKEGEAALLRVFLDKPVRYREYAAGAIGYFGEKAGDESVKALIEELDSPNGLCTCEVIASLGKIGPKARKAAPALKEIMEKEISKDDRPDEYCAKLLAGWALKRVSD